MNAVDQLVERGAERLEALSRRFAQENGLKATLAHELADDAAFIRKLKPSLIAARARGEAPPEPPARPAAEPQLQEAPLPPAEPHQAKPPKTRKRVRGGPNPFVVAGAAFAAGVMLAKWIDWRGHAHPR
ncbi:MAG TPA: hypothetical protein VGF23_21350 [Gaiellaceae bacterium]|jgi:hypothetical protein